MQTGEILRFGGDLTYSQKQRRRPLSCRPIFWFVFLGGEDGTTFEPFSKSMRLYK